MTPWTTRQRWERKTKSPVEIAVLDTGVNGIDHPLMRELLGHLGSIKQEEQAAWPGHADGFHGTGVFFARAAAICFLR